MNISSRNRNRTRKRTRPGDNLPVLVDNEHDDGHGDHEYTIKNTIFFARVTASASTSDHSDVHSPPPSTSRLSTRMTNQQKQQWRRRLFRSSNHAILRTMMLALLLPFLLTNLTTKMVHVKCYSRISVPRRASASSLSVRCTGPTNTDRMIMVRCYHNHPDHQSFVDETMQFQASNSSGINTESSSSRRFFLQNSAVAATTIGLSMKQTAWAGVAELDESTGSLYTPKKEMLSGGSAAARGIRISTTSRPALQPGQALQTVYETRFIAYLSRFLINFDPAANAWWIKNALNGGGESIASYSSSTRPTKDQLDFKFAEFAESVEIGLADYFVGPYGSYSSLSAMKAGLNAKDSVRSLSPDDDRLYMDSSRRNHGGAGWTILFDLFQKSKQKIPLSSTTKKLREEQARKSQAERDSINKQGVLNLYTLLKARYQSRTAKRQLAILFSFFSNPNIQPTAEIKSLLGEADNCTISRIDLVKPPSSVLIRNSKGQMRLSSRIGGGYSYDATPTVNIEPPPALGAAYACATALPIMRRTGRILKIRIIDGGNGYYNKPPEVIIDSPGGIGSQPCQACAILDRSGGVESVIVLDPGFGYGKGNGRPPTVTIAQPEYRGIKDSGRNRRAIAKAYLEYEIAGIQLSCGGNGYVATEPPQVTISPPEEDPDWYVDRPTFSSAIPNMDTIPAQVSEMRGPKGNVAFSSESSQQIPVKLPLQRVRDNPAELLPSAVRPILNSYGTYVIPDIAAIRTYDDIMDNPRFRAVDPLFGAIGAIPAQKSANELKPSEYARLALSGAVCTVLVRTALNPLELIKTKQQLKNDEELFAFARETLEKRSLTATSSQPSLVDLTNNNTAGQRISPSQIISFNQRVDTEATLVSATATKPPSIDLEDTRKSDQNITAGTSVEATKIGSKDLIVSLVKLRGPVAIFQSADITFLASLVFGSLGFGATEFYRRSFTMAFFSFDDGAPSKFKTELILLLAATVATLLTSAAAAPFELLRVRSMGLVESKDWNEVMKDFLNEKKSQSRKSSKAHPSTSESTLTIKGFNLKEYAPLWAGFGPTASRELAFAIPKFLAFDIIAQTITGFINSELLDQGALPVQVGVGSLGLVISAFSGAFAGIAGAFVSHPADLILTYLSASKSKGTEKSDTVNRKHDEDEEEGADVDPEVDWKNVVKELLSREGGIANLYVGLTPRLVFFFLVIGLQFFLYDYAKNLLEVGSDDLSLVLDVFFAVRQGLVDLT